MYLRLTGGTGWVPTHSRKDAKKKVVTEVKGSAQFDDEPKRAGLAGRGARPGAASLADAAPPGAGVQGCSSLLAEAAPAPTPARQGARPGAASLADAAPPGAGVQCSPPLLAEAAPAPLASRCPFALSPRQCPRIAVRRREATQMEMSSDCLCIS